MVTENTLVEEPTQDTLTFQAADDETIETQEVSTEEAAVEGEEPEVDEPPKVPPGLQKRIDKVTAMREREKERRIRAEAEARILKEQLASRAEKPPAETSPTSAPKPREEDFENYDEYQEALGDWRVDQKLADYDRKLMERYEKDKMSTSQIDFQTKFNAGFEKYDDFEEVALGPVVPITAIMADIVRDSEIPADIAYYLGKNLKEATAISHMPVIQAAKAIGKIEAEIIQAEKDNPPKPKPKLTNAPPPLNPVEGSGGTVTKDLSKMSHEEYRRYRRGEK